MTPARPTTTTSSRLQAMAVSQRGVAMSLVLVIVGVAVVVALAAVGGTYWFTANAGPDTSQKQAAKTPTEHESEVVDLDTFTVNLQGPKNQVLYIGIKLKVDNKATAKRIDDHKAELRSRLLTALSDRKAKTLKTAEGKRKLADDLRDTAAKPVNKDASPLKIDAVLFSHFVMH